MDSLHLRKVILQETCLLGWLVRDEKVNKKNQHIFLPLMTLVLLVINESPKEFYFRLLEDLPLDLCFLQDLVL